MSRFSVAPTEGIASTIARAAQTAARGGMDVTALEADLRPHLLEAL